MKQSYKEVIVGILLVVLLFGASLEIANFLQSPSANVGGTAATVNRIVDPVTNSSVDVSASTSTLVLASNVGRVYAAIVNNSANSIWISLGAAAVANKGILLNANGGSYEINPNNMYVGNIYAIASSTTSTVTIVEK